MNRREFLRAGAVAAAGLIVGDAALEAYERLTWKRRLFPGWYPNPHYIRSVRPGFWDDPGMWSTGQVPDPFSLPHGGEVVVAHNVTVRLRQVFGRNTSIVVGAGSAIQLESPEASIGFVPRVTTGFSPVWDRHLNRQREHVMVSVVNEIVKGWQGRVTLPRGILKVSGAS